MRVKIGSIQAIEQVQAKLQHANREVRVMIKGQKHQLSQNERVLEWAKEVLNGESLASETANPRAKQE